MVILKNRDELANYAAHEDVHSLTGLFVVGIAPAPSGYTTQQAGAIALPPTTDVWGVQNWGVEQLDAVQFIINMSMPALSPFLNGLQNTAHQIRNGGIPQGSQQEADFYSNVSGLLDLLPGHFSFNSSSNTVTDERYSRLIKRKDLTEWVAIPNRDVLYYVLTEAEGERYQAPLGQATVWVRGGALVQHVRTKTAKTFVRGEITRQLRAQDFDPDLEGIMRAFFDVDAEDAFSTDLGNC